MLLFVRGLCQGSCNTSVKPGFGKCLWGCGLSSGVPPPSLLPLTSDSYRKEQIRGLNCDSTLAIFTLSGDVSGCLEYQQVGMAVVFLCGCFVALSASQTHVGIVSGIKPKYEHPSLLCYLSQLITNRRALSDESEWPIQDLPRVQKLHSDPNNRIWAAQWFSRLSAQVWASQQCWCVTALMDHSGVLQTAHTPQEQSFCWGKTRRCRKWWPRKDSVRGKV